MIERERTTGRGYRPMLLTTKSLYPRWQQLLWDLRLPERHGVIVVLPQALKKTRAALLAIAEHYQEHGGTVRVIEGSPGIERYYEVRKRLSEGTR